MIPKFASSLIRTQFPFSCLHPPRRSLGSLILPLELESITLFILDADTILIPRPISMCASFYPSCMEHTPSLKYVLNYLLAQRPGQCKFARWVVHQAHQIIHMIGRPLVFYFEIEIYPRSRFGESEPSSRARFTMFPAGG